jgi:hypothetical protein
VFKKRYTNYTVDTQLITYEQTEHTMERQNKTTLRKEYKGELYWEVLNENARCWGWGLRR